MKTNILTNGRHTVEWSSFSVVPLGGGKIQDWTTAKEDEIFGRMGHIILNGYCYWITHTMSAKELKGKYGIYDFAELGLLSEFILRLTKFGKLEKKPPQYVDWQTI